MALTCFSCKKNKGSSFLPRVVLPKTCPFSGFIFFLRERLHPVVLFPEMLPGLDKQGRTAGTFDISITREKKKERGKLRGLQRVARAALSTLWEVRAEDPTFNGNHKETCLRG